MDSFRRGKRILAFLICAVMSMNLLYSANLTAFAAKEGVGVANEQIAVVTAEDWPEAPYIQAEGAVLLDADTGVVLYAKNADTCFYPASITKIMTGLLAIENGNIEEDTVTFNEEAIQALPSGYVSLNAQLGETMSLKDALYGLLMYSANDYAYGIAVTVDDTISDFVDRMNQRAKELGCRHTHFVNPNGLHDENHYTTPYDMALIMSECIKHEEFLEISGATTYTIPTNNKRTQEQVLVTRHEMLRSSSSNYYSYAVCGKTGHTTPAGYTLVTYAQKDGRNLIACVMQDAEGVTYTDTQKLFDYGFGEFKKYDIAGSDGRFSLNTEGIFKDTGIGQSSAGVEAIEGGLVVLPADVKLEDADININYLENEDESGCFAEVTYEYEGMAVGSAKLQFEPKEAEGGIDFSKNLATGISIVVINIWYVVLAVVLLAIFIAVILGVRRVRKRKNRWVWKEKK